jgi:hypothetical protein
LHVSFGYPKRKNPKSIKEMGLYNSTMALPTGFSVGLNVSDTSLMYQIGYFDVNLFIGTASPPHHKQRFNLVDWVTIIINYNAGLHGSGYSDVRSGDPDIPIPSIDR